MEVTLNGKSAEFSELKNGKITQNFSPFESRVLEIIQDWKSGKEFFEFETSGSTGDKKKIRLSRETIVYSARTTLDNIDPARQFKSTLVCINPFFVGGFMAVIRALEGGLKMHFIEPTSNPLESFTSPTDLISMVPLQVHSTLNSNPLAFNKIGTIIIGGAALHSDDIEIINSLSCDFFHSYGMTETVSHIALKNLKTDQYFHTLGDVQIETLINDCLKVKGTVTNHKWLITNDIVRIIDKGQFEFLGRADNVINSGGIKIHPEQIEHLLDNLIDQSFFITGLPDTILGTKVALVLEGNTPKNLSSILANLGKFEKPREVLTIPSFVYTETGKINRKATLKQLQ